MNLFLHRPCNILQYTIISMILENITYTMCNTWILLIEIYRQMDINYMEISSIGRKNKPTCLITISSLLKQGSQHAQFGSLFDGTHLGLSKMRRSLLKVLKMPYHLEIQLTLPLLCFEANPWMLQSYRQREWDVCGLQSAFGHARSQMSPYDGRPCLKVHSLLFGTVLMHMFRVCICVGVCTHTHLLVHTHIQSDIHTVNTHVY